MKCKHDLDVEVCLLCMYQAYTRAGKPMPEDVLLDASRMLQIIRDRSLAQLQFFQADPTAQLTEQ